MFLAEFTVVLRPELVILDEARFELEKGPKLGFFPAPGTSRIACVHPQRLPEVLRNIKYRSSERATMVEGRKRNYLKDYRVHSIGITVYVLREKPAPKGNMAGPNCSTKWAAIHGLGKRYSRLPFTHPCVFGALRLFLPERCELWVRTPHNFVVRELLGLIFIPLLEDS